MGIGGERERERDRQTDRQTERDRKRWRERYIIVYIPCFLDLTGNVSIRVLTEGFRMVTSGQMANVLLQHTHTHTHTHTQLIHNPT